MRDADSPRSAADVTDIVQRFVQARLSATALSEYPGAVPDSLGTAYQCQELAIQRWPDRIAGWKVARVPASFRSQYQEERLIGPAFQSNVRIAAPGQVVDCPVFEGGFAAVEAELVVRVANDSPQDKLQWTIEDVEPYVGSLHVGVEIASSPLATLNDLGPGAVVSDFGNNWGVILGPEIEDWRAIEEVSAQTSIDEVFVGRGAASVQQGALGALAFTLTKCAQRGRQLHAGDVISTGMITGVHDIRIGQVSRHLFEGYGEILCRAVKARPHASAS